ncbi:MAG: S8 family serine peptidase [Gammaproteobacteria bacterium]|nr:S8 family serine peptidase [Gammaproteobacteria bacterium]
MNMRDCFLLLVFSLQGVLLTALQPVLAQATNSGKSEIVVAWDLAAPADERQIIIEKLQPLTVSPIGKGGVEKWGLATGQAIDDLLGQLLASPWVYWAEPNYHRRLHQLPDDPELKRMEGFVDQIELSAAWDISTGSSKVVVAILDDSVEIDHPDLQANIWINQGEVAGNGVDDDANGYIDDLHGWDFKNNDADPSAGLEEGHGTAVAGVVGAVGNNGIGATGVAWNVSIMPLKFGFDVASGLEAAQYAIDNGADILVASFGGPAYSFSEELALQQLSNAGILVVSSAGNFHADNDRVPDYPSSADYPNILAVAASDRSSSLTSWSNRGQFSVDLMAPGESIYTTQAKEGAYSSQDYSSVNGTSLSAPYVAGVAALIKSVLPSATFQELKGRILAAVDPEESARGHLASAGRLNGYQALEVEPQPVLMVRSVALENIIGDGDQQIDSGELLQLVVVLENSWMPASGIHARLSTDSQLVDLLWDEALYADLDPLDGEAWSAGEEPFLIYIRPQLEGHQRIPFTLEINTDQGKSTIRYFELEAGALLNGVLYQEVIQQNAQDDFHSYHLDLPIEATGITVQTTVNGVTDLDLLLAEGEFPQYVMIPEGDGDHPGTQTGPMTTIDGNSGGNEQIYLGQSSAQIVEVVIVNFSQLDDQSYTIQATYDLPDGVETVSEINPAGVYRTNLASELQFSDPVVQMYFYLMSPGWNLISIPVEVEADSIQLFMQQFPEISSIWQYQQGEWKSALKGVPWPLNTLNTFEAGRAYWVKVAGGENLSAVAAGVSTQLKAFGQGWNLFGVSEPIEEIEWFIKSVGAEAVWSWDNDHWKSYHLEVPQFLNQLNRMDPGRGYYVYLPE